MTCPENGKKVFRLAVNDAPSIKTLENNTSGKIGVNMNSLRINSLSKSHTYCLRVRAMKKLRGGITICSSYGTAKKKSLSK